MRRVTGAAEGATGVGARGDSAFPDSISPAHPDSTTSTTQERIRRARICFCLHHDTREYMPPCVCLLKTKTVPIHAALNTTGLNASCPCATSMAHAAHNPPTGRDELHVPLARNRPATSRQARMADTTRHNHYARCWNSKRCRRVG